MTNTSTNTLQNASLKKEDLANLFNVVNKDNKYNAFLINKSVFFLNTNDNLAASQFDFYEVKAMDTWTTISFKFYNTVDLWWLICKVNEIVNPFEMPSPGTILKIMKSNAVYSSLLPMLKSAK